VTALEILDEHEREVVAAYRATFARAIEFVDGEERVPDALLDEIAQLEARIGVIVTLKLAIEVRP
jgi:hypothetical protein